MSHQLIFMIVLALVMAAYWRLVVGLLFAGTVILLFLGMINLAQLLHLAVSAV